MDYNQNNFENNSNNQPVEPTYQPPQNNVPQGDQFNQPPYGAPQYNQPPYGAPQYGQPPYNAPQYGQPMYQQPMYPPVAPDNSKGLAITSLVLSILSFICCGFPFSIAGFICGLVSLSRKKEQNGMAVAGVIISVLGFIATIIAIVFSVTSGTFSEIITEATYY